MFAYYYVNYCFGLKIVFKYVVEEKQAENY